MKKYFILYIITFLLSVSCERPTAGAGAIRGVVTSLETELPMYGVAVTYGDSTILTDEYGAYVFDSIPDGTQALIFYKDGYSKIMEYVHVPANKEVACDIGMELYKTGWAVGNKDSDYGVILYSADGGTSWVRQGNPSMIPNVDLLDVCMVDPNTGWAVGRYDKDRSSFTIMYTTNAGVDWTRQGNTLKGPPAGDIAAIVSKDGKSAWAVMDTTGHIIGTSNNGKSWKVMQTSEMMSYYTGITTPDGMHIWACGKSVSGGPLVEYSSDGGIKWTALPMEGYLEAQVPTSIYALDTLNLYMAGVESLGLLRSADGGQTWNLSDMKDYSDIYSIDAIDEYKIWACGEQGSVYVTENSFQTSIKSQPLSEYANGNALDISILRDGLKGAAVLKSASGASGAIIYTVDGGQNWMPSVIPFNFSLNALDFVGGNN